MDNTHRWHQHRRLKTLAGVTGVQRSDASTISNITETVTPSDSVISDTSTHRSSLYQEERVASNNNCSDEESEEDDSRPGAYAISRTRRISLEVIGWDPTEPVRSEQEETAELPTDQRERNSVFRDGTLPIFDATVDVEQNFSRKEYWSKSEKVVVIGITALCLAVGIIFAIFVAFSRQDGLVEGPSTLSEKCRNGNVDAKSTPFLQCECFGRIEVVDEDVHTYYNSLKTHQMAKHFNTEVQIDSCASDNQALVWIAETATKVEQDDVELSGEQILTLFALACLYANGGGLDWTNQRQWLNGDSCEWYGVGCNVDDKIVSLTLPENNIQGSLGSQLGLLRHLKVLNLEHNHISGTLPMELCDLLELEELSLGRNKISGTLNFHFERFSSLRKISLFENLLTGLFPRLWRLPNLESLILRETGLVGTLSPASDWDTLGQLEILDLSKMYGLSGTLPSSFASLTSLREFNLANTQLIGFLPEIIDDMTPTLEKFVASQTGFSGYIPTTVGYLTNLAVLNLESSRVTGNIPSELGMCTQLQDINLGSISLVGTLPVSLDGLFLLESLIVAYNSEISGTVPSEFSHLQRLEVLGIAQTQIGGSIPDEICDLGGSVSVGQIQCESGQFDQVGCDKNNVAIIRPPDCRCCTTPLNH